MHTSYILLSDDGIYCMPKHIIYTGCTKAIFCGIFCDAVSRYALQRRVMKKLFLTEVNIVPFTLDRHFR
jgi:hypothetical protein